MPYGAPQTNDFTAMYTARFQRNEGTQVELMFVDPMGMGTLETTDDDFQNAVDALSTAGWTFLGGTKVYDTRESVNPS